MIRAARQHADSSRAVRPMYRLTVLLLLMVVFAGCSRAFYRRQADQESANESRDGSEVHDLHIWNTTTIHPAAPNHSKTTG